MKKIFLSAISLVLVFSLATPTASAKVNDDPISPATELAEHVPGEMLVRFSPGMNSAQVSKKMAEMGVTRKREIKAIKVHLVKLPPGLSVEKAIARFSRLPGVDYVEPNYVLHIAEISHTEIVDQWGLTKIRTEQAWGELGPSEKNKVLLATVDTGIKKENPELISNIWTDPNEIAGNGIDDDGNGYIDDTWGWDFVNNDNNPTDDQMHGTAVTSVMVAAQDGTGMVGICPWCRVMAVKVLDSSGSGYLDVVANGITYAAQNGARVINLSLAGSAGSQTLQNAVNYAWNQGSVVVAAAGNDGQQITMYPAGYANAIAVASTGSADKHSCFSNYNPGFISVSAPGEAIYVVDINSANGYNYYYGTSLSTPHVSGLAGLILGKNPNLTNIQVRSLIENSSIDLGSPGVDAAFGYGRVDAYRAILGDTSVITPPDSLSSTSGTATGYAHARKLVRDNSGTLHLIWHTADSSGYRIRYATSSDNGNTWGLQPDVFNSPYETYHPALATDGNYLYAAIPSRAGASTPYRILFTRKPVSGGSWSSPVVLMGGTYNAVRPDIYVDPTNGRLHLIASSLDDSPDLYYRASNDQGVNWGNLSQFNPSGSTTYNTRYATVYANGDNVYIATRTVENLWILTYYYLYTARSTNGGATWIDKTQISSYLAVATGEYGISLAGVGNRLYMGYEVGGNIYFRRNDGAGWGNLNGPYVQLETGDADNVYKWPTITQANDGQAWMVFELNGQLYMRHYDGSTWAPKEFKGWGYYANLKRGTGGDRVEWVSTICNGSPFDLTYGSLSLGSNSPPQANGETVSTNEDTPLNITLTGSDPDGDPLTYQVVASPSNGLLSGSAPNLTYTPNLNYNGPDSFSFKANDGQADSNIAIVTITVNPVNDPPVANAQTVTTAEDTPESITLTANDADGDSLTYAVVINPTHGTLSGTAPNLTYTPNLKYNGPDSFTFKANDGLVDSNVATVLITVTAVNNAPVADSQGVTTAEDTPTTITLTASDSDNDPLSYSVVAGPANGILSGTAPNLTYTPNLNYNGPDSFTFKANDGQTDSNVATVTITVTSVNDPPVASGQAVSTPENTPKAIALTASDVDGDSLTYNVLSGPANGALSGTAPNLTYTPNPGFSGSDGFTFKANDGQADSNIATVSITVTPVTTFVDATATGEIFVAGTVSGNYLNTHADGGNIESITERESGGKPQNRYSYLEHKWTFDVTPGNTVILYANAWSGGSNDGDSFIFAYSTNDADYNNMFTVSNTYDAGYLTYVLPASTQGTVYVRVVDSNRSSGNRALDTINVDHLYIRSEMQPGDPPSAPANLSATAISAAQINLTWTDNADNESGFYIERSPNGTNWTQIAAVGANATSYADTTVSPDTTYYYRVRAFNGSGASGYSNTASATTEPLGTEMMQVSSLVGSSVVVRSKWNATVQIRVTASDGVTLIANAVVTGLWSDGTTGTAECTTDSKGECYVTKNSIKTSVPSVTFTVTSVTHPSYIYDPGSSTITVVVNQ